MAKYRKKEIPNKFRNERALVHKSQMAYLENSDLVEFELDENNESQKNEMKKINSKKIYRKKIRRRLSEIYLGSCPVCDGDVFGAVDAARCSDCGWTNKHSKYGWG